MTNKVFGLVQRIFKRRPADYLIVEERNEQFIVTRVRFDDKHKNIIILERKIAGQPGDIRRPGRLPEKIIFSLGGRKAATVESAITIRRSSFQEQITAEELEQLVFKALWEFLNRYRPWAGAKLKVPDVDLILSAIQVRDILLDNHRIFNPIGFAGRAIAFRLRGTFTTRSILPLVTKFRNWGSVIVVEGGSILATAMPADGEWLVCSNETGTSIYRRRPEEDAYFGEVDWHTRRIEESVRRELLLEPEALSELFRRYENGELSDRIRRLIEGLIRTGLLELGDAVHAYIGKNDTVSRPRVYFHFWLPLAAETKWPKYLRGDILRLDERLERENFTINIKPPAAGYLPSRDQLTFALLLYSCDVPQYGFLNDLVRRRARWLIPNF